MNLSFMSLLRKRFEVMVVTFSVVMEGFSSHSSYSMTTQGKWAFLFTPGSLSPIYQQWQTSNEDAQTMVRHVQHAENICHAINRSHNCLGTKCGTSQREIIIARSRTEKTAAHYALQRVSKTKRRVFYPLLEQ